MQLADMRTTVTIGSLCQKGTTTSAQEGGAVPKTDEQQLESIPEDSMLPHARNLLEFVVAMLMDQGWEDIKESVCRLKTEMASLRVCCSAFTVLNPVILPNPQ